MENFHMLTFISHALSGKGRKLCVIFYNEEHIVAFTISMRELKH